DGGAQVDIGGLKAFGPHGHPPVDIAGVPLLQGLEHALVVQQADVVGDLGRIIDVGGLGHRGVSFVVCVRVSVSLCVGYVAGEMVSGEIVSGAPHRAEALPSIIAARGPSVPQSTDRTSLLAVSPLT